MANISAKIVLVSVLEINKDLEGGNEFMFINSCQNAGQERCFTSIRYLIPRVLFMYTNLGLAVWKHPSSECGFDAPNVHISSILRAQPFLPPLLSSLNILN